MSQIANLPIDVDLHPVPPPGKRKLKAVIVTLNLPNTTWKALADLLADRPN